MKKLKQSKREIQWRAKEIIAIYKSYFVKFNVLKRKQSEIVNQFVKELEHKKIEEIQVEIKKSF